MEQMTMRGLLFAGVLVFITACGDDEDSGPITAPVSAASDDESSPEIADGESEIPPFELMRLRDVETGSLWNLRGEAITGELAGSQLELLPAYSAYWFAWASFWSESAVWGEGGNGLLSHDVFSALPVSEYIPDVPKDAIPPLDEEDLGFGHATFDFVTDFLADGDIVLGVAISGEARAYPIKILNWHEIVNHELGDAKISVTYCPLTASGLNFAAEGIAFGNTGGLHKRQPSTRVITLRTGSWVYSGPIRPKPTPSRNYIPAGDGACSTTSLKDGKSSSPTRAMRS